MRGGELMGGKNVIELFFRSSVRDIKDAKNEQSEERRPESWLARHFVVSQNHKMERPNRKKQIQQQKKRQVIAKSAKNRNFVSASRAAGPAPTEQDGCHGGSSYDAEVYNYSLQKQIHYEY